MFEIEMLPAQRGDALWIRYGDRDKPRHALVDGGPSETIETLVPELEERIRRLPGRQNRLELLAMTHVDTDHIQGVVSLLSEPSRVRLFRDVWLNAYEHLLPVLGAWDGERLTAVPRRRARPLEQGVRRRPGRRPGRGPAAGDQTRGRA
jgi:glyoxylase-like metal-dependent hydrolase (beta-lactamase superfamily II)